MEGDSGEGGGGAGGGGAGGGGEGGGGAGGYIELEEEQDGDERHRLLRHRVDGVARVGHHRDRRGEEEKEEPEAAWERSAWWQPTLVGVLGIHWTCLHQRDRGEASRGGWRGIVGCTRLAESFPTM